ncbi:MAG: hypothetical protein NT175_00555 [Bacteroidetes bacterium]|nr:hypothetical protein [Bacteroidota bacterium]
MRYDTFQIFATMHHVDFDGTKFKEIKDEILGRSKDYILNVDEIEFQDAIYDKFKLDKLVILVDQLSFNTPKKSNKFFHDRFSGKDFEKEIYEFDFKIPFYGSSDLLKVKPPTFVMTTIEIQAITIYEPIEPIIKEQYLKVVLEVYNADEKEFEERKKEILNKITANIDNVNQYAEVLNQRIKALIIQTFQKRKEQFIKENDFFKAIDLKVNESTTTFFNASPIRKKKIPIPKIEDVKKKYFDSPQITDEIYKDVNHTILNYCKSIEQKPSIYKDKDEESLRFLILSVLESRYESITATGETFNKGGRSDILLKYQDGSNLYVAECKIWKGEKMVLEAIDQLISYLTWRDSKTALIIFVKTIDFSNVLDKIEKIIQTHKNFIKLMNSSTDKTSLSCAFNFPDDSKKQFFMEIMSFHFN